MKNYLIVLLVTICGLLTSQLVYGQTKEIAKGNEAFELGEYYTAIESYKVAYEKAKDPAVKSELIFKISLCYRSLSLAKEAELWFKKAIKVKYPDPLAVLYYADALKMNGAFEEAAAEYQKYGKLVPGDKRAENGVKSCEMSAKWREKPTRYKVENMALFNSKDMDFCPVFAKKDYKVLYFSSNRAGSTGSSTHAVTGAGFTDLWETAQDRKGKWSEATPLGPEINTTDDEGASSLNLKGSNLYFTRCKVVKKVNMGCKLYMATKKGTGWGEALEIKITGVGDSISVGHPAISDDEMTLYFAADMQGGYGGKDIWMLRREKKGAPFIPDPVNMGPDINTPGNEVYPHIRPDGSLFFSSDYHVGMGGLDIFKGTLNKQTGKWKIRNMRYPINSPADDFGVIFQGDEESGFFTSNRTGGKGGDDIYYFYLPPLEFYLTGIVTDCKSEKILAGAKIIIKGSDGLTQEMLAEADGSYKFKLEAGVDYQISVEKEGTHLNGRGGVSTKNIEESQDFKVDICLEPIEKPIELPNIFYDLNKWDLRPESFASLDKLVITLNENPNIVIELGSHTDFRSDNKYNLELSQKRAESVVNYLIEKGIEPERLVAKGYGEEKPNTVNKANAERYPGFLVEGQVLTEPFIKKLATIEEQEVAHQINRRTEFRVLRSDYVPKKPVNIPQNMPQQQEEEDDEQY